MKLATFIIAACIIASAVMPEPVSADLSKACVSETLSSAASCDD